MIKTISTIMATSVQHNSATATTVEQAEVKKEKPEVWITFIF